MLKIRKQNHFLRVMTLPRKSFISYGTLNIVEFAARYQILKKAL